MHGQLHRFREEWNQHALQDAEWNRSLGLGNHINAQGPRPIRHVDEECRQLAGLRLQPTRAPFDVIVIDRIERPSEN